MKRAIFLDRDGVINRERGEHTWNLEDFEILPDVPAALEALKAAGWLVVVISNQSGVGLGLYTLKEVERLHGYLHHRLGNAPPDAVYYCPHHPQQGRCLCRKPGGLLFERAIARFGIDPRASLMVGDRERDIAAAAAAGVRGVLVPSNASLLTTLQHEGIL
jgi:D-glycero-D-manno-heptose 1,7-bisphosphate phosphatase